MLPASLRAFFLAAAVLFLPGLQSLCPGADLSITDITWTPAGPALQWPEAGKAYTVEYKDQLLDPIWRVPFTFYPLFTNQWYDASAFGPNRFYRLLSVAPVQRGAALSTSFQGTLSTAELALLFNLGGVLLTPQYPVRLYTLVYQTITPWGAGTTASGALMLPDNAPGPYPLASYQHGTITVTNYAPSALVFTNTIELGIGLALATSGYAAALPDYLGLGESPGLHPYHHARSEASATIDFLRAVRSFCASNGVALTNRLFLLGYSQGGHATMATLREIETFHTNEFNVVACAPMAGAYDLSGVTAADFLSGRTQPNPYYFLYLLGAYQAVYGLAPTLGDLLAPPYNTTLPPLLNGAIDGGQINDALPKTNIVAILKPEVLADFKTNPRNALRLALQDNDVYLWRPRSPMRMYHCPADQDVVIANSQVAFDNFQALGATNVSFIQPFANGDHGTCALPSLLQAKQWFDSLK